MKRKDPLKILTSQTKANVSFLMMSSPNGTISSNVALNRRKLRKLLFTHYLRLFFLYVENRSPSHPLQRVFYIVTYCQLESQGEGRNLSSPNG